MMRNGYTTRAAVSSWDKNMTHDESFYYGNEPSILSLRTVIKLRNQLN